MEHLERELNALMSELPDEDELRIRLESLQSVFPFNEYEYVISTLLGRDSLTLERYYDLRDPYIERNCFLHIFDLTTRRFGDTWAFGQLKSIIPEIRKPSRDLDPTYQSQEYDAFLDGIRIEIKSARALDRYSAASLTEKALASDSEKPFDMIFQQLKADLCDVFVWIAVWRDTIRYWVLSSHEVKTNQYYSDKQHRGNEGEGQLHIKNNNIAEFDRYECRPAELEIGIRSAFDRLP
ncbi:MAG: hypothetical protein OXN88_00685 [Chloroflexota bacterium]|nr:hypothetical protein [Chloroflexota bacterium]